MFSRAFVFVAFVLAALVLPSPAAALGSDALVARSAALSLGHESPAQVAHWLRAQPSVRWARIEGDRTTVSIGFRDGRVSAILGRLQPLGLRPVHGLQAHPLLRANAGVARAAVLLPFASELGVGQSGGDPEIKALQSAGFRVDSAYDQQVTLATVQSMSQYNVVYDWTHTGVFSGSGWLATGQIDSCPSHFNADGMTAVLNVAGSSQCYLAVNAKYIATQLAAFASRALVFINGCTLLNSDPFWQALAGKGVGAMVSWDNDSATYDDYLSAAAFFNQMSGGASVQSALNTLYAAGYGHSSYQGQPAMLGYRGDGSLTLTAAAAGGSPPPTSTAVPTATPSPTPTATGTPQPTATTAPTSTPTEASATSTPTATNTPVPPSPTLEVSGSVKPGQQQTLTVHNADPGSLVSVTVTFPDGRTLGAVGTATVDGTAHISFTQPPGRITRHRSAATVVAKGSSPAGPYRLEQKYTIAFGAIDLTVQPWHQTAGHYVNLWVHTAKRTAVTFTVHVRGHKSVTMRGKTGAQGWAGVRYRLPKTARGAVTVRVDARVGHKILKATSAVVIA